MSTFYSICIPCYKRIPYVLKTLDSIYRDNNDVQLSDYEVIISDNDPEKELSSFVQKYNKYDNFHYIATSCEGFMNSYYALSYGTGAFLKLHNSQNVFLPGSLKLLIEEARKAEKDHTIIEYSNGFLSLPAFNSYCTFEEFMCNLSYWSSWSGGFCMWRSDFVKFDKQKLDDLFPHTSLFLTQWDAKSYIIDNRKIYKVQRVPKRGGHNKFKAFTINYPALIDQCYNDGHISKHCKDIIYNDLVRKYIPSLLIDKYIAKIEKFDASGFRKNSKVYLGKYAYIKSWLYVPLVAFQLFKRKFL